MNNGVFSGAGKRSALEVSGKGLPIGSQQSVPVNQAGSGIYVAPDGTEWLSSAAPLEYSQEYEHLPDDFKSPHSLIYGPYGGGFLPNTVFAYSGSVILASSITGSISGDTTNGYIYNTSSDGGVTWTERTFPNLKGYLVCYTAGKFVGVAASSTTSGVITSTDGVTWNSYTGVSLTPIDVVSDGSNNLVCIGASTTAGMYSTDGGATWSSCTLPASTNSNTFTGNGFIAYCPSAGLFLVALGSGGYATSPTGATWTARQSQATFSKYNGLFSSSAPRFAANNSIIVAVGQNGFFATSTDGLAWSNHGYIAQDYDATGSPLCVYHDGSRFVVCCGNSNVYTSTNGTTWTKAGMFFSVTTNTTASSGVVFRSNGSAIKTPVTALFDATATAPKTIFTLRTGGFTGVGQNSVRIK